MNKRSGIALGIGAGVIWAVGVVWIGVAVIKLPIFALLPALAFAFLGPGLVLIAMIGWLARPRYIDDAATDGQRFAPGSPTWIDRRVLADTVEQTVLALCLWPPAAYLLLQDGPGVVVALGIGFALARVAFWIGHRRGPALRTFGFAATFCPTVAVMAFAVGRWVAKGAA